LSQAELKTQLQSTFGPVTCVKDAHAWLNMKGWILAGEKYTKLKLTDILFTVALTQKLSYNASSTIRPVASLIEELAEQDLSASLVNMVADKISSQINSLTDNLATRVASTKEFLNAVTHQQVESTLAFQEYILSNAKSFKSIANTAEKLLDTTSKQSDNLEWSMLPSSSLATGNSIDPASLIHTTLSTPHIKIWQHTFQVAKQLLIALGSLDEDTSPVEKSVQNQKMHQDLLNSWFDDDKANNKFTVPSKAA
jgi:hypothetical protein